MYKILISFVFFGSGLFENHCPKFLTCESSGNQDWCDLGTFYRQNVKVGGCCSGCITLKGENRPCRSSYECQPGLACGREKICEKDSLQACEYYKLTNAEWEKKKYWNPSCLSDGTYAYKQCKGEKMSGKCFCSDKMGNRIFGEEEWSESKFMECVCSRLADENKQKGLEVSVHCNQLGNFEPLQCDQKICWCASARTGFPYAMMVPSGMIIFLPCYKKTQVGMQYYRKCDSERHTQKKIKTLLKNHGTNQITFIVPNCNFDGTYQRVQTVKERNQCVYINNLALTEVVSMGNTNCNCAYDRHVSKLRQILFLFDCEPNGNYKTRQIWNKNVYCVDSDGFTYSNESDDCTFSLIAKLEFYKQELNKAESFASVHGSTHSKSNVSSGITGLSASESHDSDQQSDAKFQWKSQWQNLMFFLAQTTTWLSFARFNTPNKSLNCDNHINLLQIIGVYMFFGCPTLFIQLFIGQFTQKGCLVLGEMMPVAYGLGYFILFNTILGGILNLHNCVFLLDYVFMALLNHPVPPWMLCFGDDFYGEKVNCLGLTKIEQCEPCYSSLAKDQSSCYDTENMNLSAVLFMKFVARTNDDVHDKALLSPPSAKYVIHSLISAALVSLAIVKTLKDLDGAIRIWNIFVVTSITVMIAVIAFTSLRVQGVFLFFRLSWPSFYSIKSWVGAFSSIVFNLKLHEGGNILFGSYTPVTVNTIARAKYLCIAHFILFLFINTFLFLLLENLLCQMNMNLKALPCFGAIGDAYALYPSALGLLAAAPLWTTLYFIINFGLTIQTIILQIITAEATLSDELINSSYYIYTRFFLLLFGFLICIFLGTPQGANILVSSSAYVNMIRMGTVFLFLCVILLYGFQRLYDDVYFLLRNPPSFYLRSSWFLCLIFSGFGFFGYLTYGKSTNRSALTYIIMTIVIVTLAGGFFIKFIKYLKAKDLMSLLRQADTWGPSDSEAKTNRKLFNPRYEVRFRQKVEKCKHRSLLSSSVLKKTLENELALVSNVLLEIEDDEENRKLKQNEVENLQLHRNAMSKFLTERAPEEIAFLFKKHVG